MDTFLTWSGYVIGVVGLVGTPLAIISFMSPRHRMNRYLNKPNKWRQVNLAIDGSDSIWQYEPHPEFTIKQQDSSREWDYGVTEKWMKYPLPDPSKSTYMTHAKSGDVVVYAEEFISLDGGRYFVPLPKVHYRTNKNDNEYFYAPSQVKISRIIGYYYRMKSIDEFIERNELAVMHKENTTAARLQTLRQLLVG